MGKCIYCGEDAGFLRSKHKECYVREQQRIEMKRQQDEQIALETRIEAQKIKDAQDKVTQEILDLINASILPGGDPATAFEKAKELLPSSGISDLNYYMGNVWSRAMDSDLANGLLSKETEDHLDNVLKGFGLKSPDVKDAWIRRGRGIVTRDVLEGKVPTSYGIDFDVPLNLQKGEVIIWAWANVKYFEDRIVRKGFQGRSQGMSFRIMKGVSYRVGAFRGEPIISQEHVLIGTGALAFTQKHLYWGGGDCGKAIRIPWGKIIAVRGFSDGIGIQKDAASAKPMAFQLGDGEGEFFL